VFLVYKLSYFVNWLPKSIIAQLRNVGHYSLAEEVEKTLKRAIDAHDQGGAGNREIAEVLMRDVETFE
jgi:hypothetical protein